MKLRARWGAKPPGASVCAGLQWPLRAGGGGPPAVADSEEEVVKRIASFVIRVIAAPAGTTKVW
jgi:hypothetical protein